MGLGAGSPPPPLPSHDLSLPGTPVQDDEVITEGDAGCQGVAESLALTLLWRLPQHGRRARLHPLPHSFFIFMI